MSYGELEKKVIELAAEHPVNIESIQALFDQGADPNAFDEYDESDPEDYELLFTACFDFYNAPNLYALLECFLKNGLDIKKYAERIISDLIYLGENDRFKMVQLIFDSLPGKIAMEKALESIAGEASFYNCNQEFYDGKRSPDWESNELYGLYELIKAYAIGEEYDGFKQLPDVINQKLISISVAGDWILADEEKMVYRYKDNTVFMIIQMEQDTLFIKNGFTAFINNNSNMKKQQNTFTLYAEDILKGEIVEKVCFNHYSINITDRRPQDGRIWLLSGKTVTLELSGGKEIVFVADIDSKNDTVFIHV